MTDRTRERNNRIRCLTLGVVLTFAMFLTACESDSKTAQTLATESSEERYDTGYVVTNPDSYDSADTALLLQKNSDESTLVFLNLELGKQYTLEMDGTTRFMDRYGKAISLAQVEPGDLVDVTFLKSKKHLTSLALAAEAWELDSIERYELNTTRRELTVGTDVYKLSGDIRYFSQGEIIEEMDLNASDILTVQGIGTTVQSIVVEKGHGYLRLVNDENFIGGWLEIGTTQIVKITEDMLLTVPEGSYDVTISLGESGGTKSVAINAGEETALDIGDLEIAETKQGTVLFSLSPSDAELYVDGTQVDTSQAVTLDYGIHQLIARADGYQSLTQYLRVGQASAGINIELEKNDSDEDTSASSSSSTSSSSSSSQASSTASSAGSTASSASSSATSSSADTTDAGNSYYKVRIEAPEGVEVYLDGNYVGIAPCSFKKTAGSHVITLRKTGYETRSYTVQVDDEEKDISYSFVDLEASASN